MYFYTRVVVIWDTLRALALTTTIKRMLIRIIQALHTLVFPLGCFFFLSSWALKRTNKNQCELFDLQRK